MATATLSLFPTASVKKERLGQKGALRYVSRSRAPDFEMVKLSGDAQGFVLAIEETPVPPSPEEERVTLSGADSSTSSSVIPSITLSTPPKARIAKEPDTTATRARTPSPILTQPRVQVRPRSRSISPAAVKLPESPLQVELLTKDCSNSPRLLRKGSSASFKTATHSPVMRSMFPRYDANVPLGQQQYRPGPSYAHQRKQALRPALPALDIPPAPTGVAPILQQTSSSGLEASVLSSTEELLNVWNIANGQSVESTVASFDVELICESLTRNEEIITFSSPKQTLYTLSSEPDQITISRTHPTNPTPTIQICHTSLSLPTATAPLVALIFPKLSELMALDQSSTIAVSHGLDRQASADLQAEALARAQQNEASSLMWDSDSGNYFLIHPTLLDNTYTRFPIKTTPSSSNPERIVIYAPETDSATPVLELALSTRTLTIHTTPIIALPSLYTLDTVITALLMFLLHLHRSSSTSSVTQPQNDIILPSFPPPPSVLSTSSRMVHKKKCTLSTWTKSVFSASTGHLPRDEESGLVRSEPNGVMPSQTKALESEWGFKPMIDPDDEKLPTATRTALRGLYWTFEVIVWILGVFVNLIAAGIVGTGRVIKKL
ncbi:MAG: hypothetical protein Q9191_002585 [Dirinaria sp. TL-2023a]